MSWYVLVPKLEEVLRQHLCDEAAGEADGLYDTWTAASALQKIERNDEPPTSDIQELKRAETKLLQAASNIRKIGWYGDSSLRKLASELSSAPRHNNHNLLDAMESTELLAAHLEAIAKRVGKAHSKIDPKKGSLRLILDSNANVEAKPGRPFETASYLLTRKCAELFRSYTGKPPTLVINRENANVEGRFPNFVKAVFEILGIKANLESEVKKVVRKKSPS